MDDGQSTATVLSDKRESRMAVVVILLLGAVLACYLYAVWMAVKLAADVLRGPYVEY